MDDEGGGLGHHQSLKLICIPLLCECVEGLMCEYYH